jgi:hypothetical protein
MFGIIQIKDGRASSLKPAPMASTLVEANEILQREMVNVYPQLVNPLLSTDAKIEYDTGLEKLTDGAEFVVKDPLAAPANGGEVKASATSTAPTTGEVKVATPPAEAKDVAPIPSTTATSEVVTTSQPQLQASWKKYKKTIEVVPGYVYGETKTSKAQFVSEYQIVDFNLDSVKEFVDQVLYDEKEQTEMDVSKSRLDGLIAEYKENTSKNCINYNVACVFGNIIRLTLLDVHCEQLLTWCLTEYNADVKGQDIRADIANLIGYIYRHRKNDEARALAYFRVAANFGYPLAMTNLLASNKISGEDKAKWTKAVTESGYKSD